MAAAMACVAKGGVSECRERHYAHQGEQKEAGGGALDGKRGEDDGGHGEGRGERGGCCFSHDGELCKQGGEKLDQAEVTAVTAVTAVRKRN